MAIESTLLVGPFVGRDAELSALRRAVEEAAQSGQALLLRGDPGVGKSALLQAVGQIGAAQGWRVLRTDGTPAEQRLPLAGLHKLLRPVRSRIPELLPGGPREALEGTFGFPQADLDIYRVALACLDLFSALARSARMVVLVDDAHWLDRSSAEVLAFVARRLEADPVLLVAASRFGPDQPLADAGLPELEVGPLDGPASAALLDRSAPNLESASRRSVLETAAGNPLALLELPQSLSGAGRDDPGGTVHLTRRLERGFLGRTRELPPATRDLLLVAAVNDSDDLAEVLAAAGMLAEAALRVEDLHPAVADGLIRLDPSTIAFRHPLVRSAVQQGIPAERRRAAHTALAEVVIDQPDRRVWHRAAAVAGSDEAVAAELADAAARAQRRGAVPGALQALERAAELSGSGTARGRRLLRAAELAAEAGRPADSRGYLGRARPLLADPHDRLRLDAVDEITDGAMLGGAARVDALIGLAEDARIRDDQDLALRFLLRAAMRCWHLDFGPEVEHRVLAAADRLGAGVHDPRRLVIYAYASPFECAATVLDVLTGRSPQPDDDPADLLMYGYAGACTGAYREAETYCRAAADGLREQGRLTLLAEALSLLAWSALRRSRWRVAAPAAEECVRIAREIRQPVPEAAGLAAGAAIAGIRGDVATADELAGQAEELATATRNTIGLAVTHLARGLTAAGRGRQQEAFEQFWHLYAPHDPAAQRMQACRTIGHLAEAASRTGHAAAARAELARFESLAARTPADGVQVALRLARAFLAEPSDAEHAFTVALDADWSDWAFEHGRLLLGYGSWLRRSQRVTESRVQLRAALHEFTSSGAVPWAEQAQRELRAAGEAGSGPGSPATLGWEQLSPREAQIAELVVEGFSNKEIGQRLYLSPRTVSSHLYRVFPKLGVTSRGQLARALSRASPGDDRGAATSS
ncbi:MAG: transcriptional regulator, LuxR family [Frankiales bacterium]|nr:transcriptional regulator, LuxR family [Frankiales bacterium]